MAYWQNLVVWTSQKCAEKDLRTGKMEGPMIHRVELFFKFGCGLARVGGVGSEYCHAKVHGSRFSEL